MNRTTSLLIAAAGALAFAGCASGDDETAASTTEVVADAASPSQAPATTDAPVSSEATPVETTPPPATSAPEPAPTSAPPATAAPGGDFCDELRTFLTAWVDDEIGPADLTPLYASLAAIAPPELVEPLRILEEDNAILVDTLDSGEIDEEAYFAAGEQLASYAEDECGIALEEL